MDPLFRGDDEFEVFMTMDSFYTSLGFSVSKKEHLTLNGVDLTTLITEDRPVYVMNELLIRQHIQAYSRVFQQYYPRPTSIFYASKAFLTLGLAQLMGQEDIGLDVCSEGELFVAETAGIPAHNILMHGNNKSRVELQAALDKRIYAIVLDSVSEFDMLESLLTNHKPAVMLRVNPTVKVDTHPSIATAVHHSKFGLPIDDPQTLNLILRLSRHPGIVFKGLHFHVGSQVFDLQAYTDSVDSILSYLIILKGQVVDIDTLNIGGGLGVSDQETTLHAIERFAKYVCTYLVQQFQSHDLPLPKLAIEPGRSVVAQAGCTLYRVGHIKEIEGTTFLAVHGGMSDNPRVALYQAKYNACVANKMDKPAVKRYKVVGNCCETGDVLIEDILLPECVTGDIIAVFNTGAYNHSMASQYNKHLLPGVIFVQDGAYTWNSRPQRLEDLIRQDVM